MRPVAARCRYHVQTLGQCELPVDHHGPCTVGRAQAYQVPAPCGRVEFVGYAHFRTPRSCDECDRIDAEEVLRLNAGGDLRPLQIEPPWRKLPVDHPRRARIVRWATALLGGSS